MANDIVRVCIDRDLPLELQVEAASRAIEQNPANVPVFEVLPELGVFPPTTLELAVYTGKRWENGRTLRARFLEGDPEVQSRVEEYAHQWSLHANITFEFGSDPEAEIRIAFQNSGSWSNVGTDALSVDMEKPTMNLGWLTSDTPDEEYRRVVLHEFGHALGCIHEHQQPAAGIPWDKEAVYAYYMAPPISWAQDKIDRNFFERYSETMTNYSAFDEESIMLYPVPNEFTVGDYQVDFNRELSSTDKEFIGGQYPFAMETVAELLVDGSPTEASIENHGEEDVFKFVVVAEGGYIIETEGPTDIVMKLFGPDGQTNLIAQDDDSGHGYNAMITTPLQPGMYYLRVKHYRPRSTGNYKISVRAG